MFKLYLLIFLSILTGCATQPQIHLHKDASQSVIEEDESSCKLEAMKMQTADFEYRGTFLEGANIQNKQKTAYILCLKSKGFTE